jgi:hypothetical protein
VDAAAQTKTGPFAFGAKVTARRSRSLPSKLDLLSYLEGIVDFDAEVSDGAFQLRTTEE